MAHADSMPDLDRIALADISPLSSDDMENLRGGFVDPTGLLFNFSVNVQTAIDGAEVYTKSITVNTSGLNGQIQTAVTNSLQQNNMPTGLTIGAISGGSGVTVSNASGTVATVLSQTAAGAPASIILNTSSNINLSQTVTAALSLQSLTAI